MIYFMDRTNNATYYNKYMETQQANFENDWLKVTSSGYSWTVTFKKAAVAYPTTTSLINIDTSVAPTSYSAGQSVSPNLAKGFVILW